MRQLLSRPVARRLAWLVLAAAAAVAVVLLVDDLDRPTVEEVALRAQLPPTADALVPTAGVRCPDWRELGWRTTGMRVDRVTDDRLAWTTSYAGPHGGATCTVVDGNENVDDELGWVEEAVTLDGRKVGLKRLASEELGLRLLRLDIRPGGDVRRAVVLTQPASRPEEDLERLVRAVRERPPR